MNVVAGLDLGDQYSHVCLLDLEGNIVERVRVRTTVQQFEKYFGAWASMRVVFEASPTRCGSPAAGTPRSRSADGRTHRLALRIAVGEGP